MSSLNKVTLIGRLGKDPDIRRSNAGEPIVSFSLATGERWKDKTTSEWKERTEWHNVVIFNAQLAEVAEKYLKKGARVWVCGAMQTRKWTDKSGTERYVTEVVLKQFRGELTMLDSTGNSTRPPPADPEDYAATSTREPSGQRPTSMKDTLPDDYMGG